MKPADASVETAAALERKRALERALRAQHSAVLVVNTRSRRGRRLFEEARRLLVARGTDLAGTYAVRNPARVPEIVAGAVQRGHRLVIVGGGDGTISSVVGCFAYREAVLAILPLGTANSFARAVGIPLDLAQAVEIAAGGKVADVDLGRIDDHYFANAAAIGLPASIARSMPAPLKRWLGRAGYLLVAAARLLRHRSFRCVVKADTGSRSFEALEVRVANGAYQGGVRVADQASVESRDLTLQYITGRSRASIVRFWWKATLGTRERQDDVEVLRASAFEIDCLPGQYVSIDGEPVTHTPVRACVARQALLLRVARAQQGIE
jgi:YegS/Rv2252/BmrU family lipid kinase